MEGNIKLAILYAIPTVQSLEDFKENEKGEVDAFIKCASSSHLIPKEDLYLFKEFIDNNSLKENPRFKEDSKCSSMEAFVKEKKFQQNQTLKSAADEINKLIDKYYLGIKHINPPLISKLHKHGIGAPRTRIALRCIAFWCGHNEIKGFNYLNLLSICKKEKKWDDKKGVRIAFSIISRGDVVDDKVISWLKKAIEDFVKQDDYYRELYNKIKSYSTTSFYIDLPNDIDYSHLVSFRKSLGMAISLSHQITVQWSLSDFATHRRLLTIAIIAGEFENLDLYPQAQTILNTELLGDPIIRMTDYTRQCALTNGMKTIFCNNPKEVQLPNGEISNIYWIKDLWSPIYMDFIPSLLNADNLPDSLGDLRSSLWSFFEDQIEGNRNKNAILKYYEFPQNLFLGMEIAKTLFYKRMFFEADEIIKIVLSKEPYHITARSLRMMIYWNLGITEKSYDVSMIQFNHADKQGVLFEENSSIKDEDFYCEYALGKVAQAVTILTAIRLEKIEEQQNYKDDKPSEKIRERLKPVKYLLNNALNIFEKAIAISPTNGPRSFYWIVCVRSLVKLLEKDEKIILEELPLDKHSAFSDTAEEAYRSVGWLRQDYLPAEQYTVLQERSLNIIEDYDNSVSLSSYLPNLKFAYSVFLWDFNREITVGIAKKVLEWLVDAMDKAKKLDRKLSIYACTRFQAELLPVDTFLKHIEIVMDNIQKKAGTLDDLKNRNENEKIEPSGLKLCLINMFNHN